MDKRTSLGQKMHGPELIEEVISSVEPQNRLTSPASIDHDYSDAQTTGQTRIPITELSTSSFVHSRSSGNTREFSGLDENTLQPAFGTKNGLEIKEKQLPMENTNIDRGLTRYQSHDMKQSFIPLNSKDGNIDISRIEALQRTMLGQTNLPPNQANKVQASTVLRSPGHDADNDHSWMKKSVPIDTDYAELQHNIATLQRREETGKISAGEKITLGRLKKELLLQRKFKIAAARTIDEADEDSLFIPDESLNEAAQRHARTAPRISNDKLSDGDIKEGAEVGKIRGASSEIVAAENMDVDEEENYPVNDDDSNATPPQKKARQATNLRRKPAKTAREYYERQQQDRRSKEREKAQRKKARNSPKTSRKDSKAKRGKATKNQKANLKVHRDLASMLNSNHVNDKDGEDDIAKRFIDDLKSGDQIMDRIMDPIFNTAPNKGIFARRKDTQFQKLLEDLPRGSNSKSARSDKERLMKASRSFGFGKVSAVDGMWLVKGMRSPLYHHQLLGSQWMLEREFGSGTGEPPFGGLLADAMGLGKTVQTLACMVGNPPQEEDRKRGRGATLIIAPSTIIPQWMDEIYVHAKESVFPKIYHYKTRSKMSRAILESLDIVVTSYTEVMRQFPWPETKEERKFIKDIGFEAWIRDARTQAGVLHQISWYRVVLDEAHAIKNDKSRTSKACQNLTSCYKWCLTGTPLMNKMEEIYPYLRFIRADYEIDWEMFQKQFCDPRQNESYARFAALLSNKLLRRTMKTPIMNRPIITLPVPHAEIRYASFSPQERLIYEITENCFRTAINKLLEDGSAQFKYTHIFIYLLRLRKCVSHPYMLEETIKEHWSGEDLERLKDGLSKLSHGHTRFYEQCEVWVRESQAERQARKDAAENQGNTSKFAPNMPFGASDFGHHFKMVHMLEDKEVEQITCGICGNFPEEPQKTDCGHIFCQECLESNMHIKAAAEDFEYFVCPHCDKVFTDVTPCNGEGLNAGDEADTLDFDDMGSRSRRGKSKGKRRSISGPGTDEMGFEPSSAPSTWLTRSDTDPDSELLPSTKVTVLKSILLKGFEEAPMDKVVIYVQFRLLARIIGRMCKKEGWRFVYLTGDTTLDQRTSAINMFRDEPDVKILIAGLRCGGLGLNLAFANRCILLDLWWNHAVEQQAFGRIFRLGQKKETHMTRIAVRDTIDMRFLSVQLYKLRNCDNAMEERAKLGLAELMKLFGFLRTDEDGNIIGVEPDYLDQNVQGAPQNENVVLDRSSIGKISSHGSSGEWSFGDDTQVRVGTQPSGSNLGATGSPNSATTLPLSHSGSDDTESTKNQATDPSYLAPANSSSITDPAEVPISIWGRAEVSSSYSSLHSINASRDTLATGPIPFSPSSSTAGFGAESPSSPTLSVSSSSKSNPIKAEDISADNNIYSLGTLNGSGSREDPMEID